MARIPYEGQIEHPSKRVAIVKAIFGVFSRKRFSEKLKYKENKEPNFGEENQNHCNNVVPPSDPFPKEHKIKDEHNVPDDDYLNQPLPPPPGSSFHFSRSYSMAVARASNGGGGGGGGGKGSKLRSRSMSIMRFSWKDRSGSEDSLLSRMDTKKDKKMQREDSLWKKTIILGDKCNPDENEDSDTIMCDEKGKIISAYHKRTSVSRQSSCIDPDDVQDAISNKG